jgi:hypothetical protein
VSLSRSSIFRIQGASLNWNFELSGFSQNIAFDLISSKKSATALTSSSFLGTGCWKTNRVDSDLKPLFFSTFL